MARRRKIIEGMETQVPLPFDQIEPQPWTPPDEDRPRVPRPDDTEPKHPSRQEEPIPYKPVEIPPLEFYKHEPVDPEPVDRTPPPETPTETRFIPAHAPFHIPQLPE